MADLYFARPFVSHAGPDGNGYRAEVLVTKGVAQVTDIKEHGDTAQVTLTCPERNFPISGWINTDTEAFRLAKKALEAGSKPVAFRIETQRRLKNKNTGAEIKPETPIYELMGGDSEGHNKNMATTNANTRKLLVAVGKPNQEMFYSQDLTNPAEDPNSYANRSTSARSMKTPPTAGNGAFPAGTHQAHAGGFVEVQQWFGQNPTGEVNPGSYGVETELDFYFWALELNAKKALGLNETRARILANALAGIAEKLQVSVYDGRLDNADRNIGSFTRVRWILKKAMEVDPNLSAENFKTQKTTNDYLSGLSVHALELWRWAIENYAKSLGVAPYGDEQPAQEAAVPAAPPTQAQVAAKPASAPSTGDDEFDDDFDF